MRNPDREVQTICKADSSSWQHYNSRVNRDEYNGVLVAMETQISLNVVHGDIK